MEEWLTKLSETDAAGATPVERVVRPAVAFMAVLLLGVAVLFGIEQNVAGVAAAATPAVFCLVFVFLPRFSEVAIWGFKAKLLDQKIHEADLALDRLKALTLVVAKAAYESLTYGNRMTNFPLTSKQQQVREIDRVMADLGINGDLLKTERDRFLGMHMFDIGQVVERSYRHRAGHVGNDMIAQPMMAALASVDTQDIIKTGDALPFFDKLLDATHEIDFSQSPADKSGLIALLTEGRDICVGMLKAGTITDRAREYLEACLNQYPGQIKRLLARHGLDKIDHPD
jgi:hypothetical protein